MKNKDAVTKVGKRLRKYRGLPPELREDDRVEIREEGTTVAAWGTLDGLREGLSPDEIRSVTERFTRPAEGSRVARYQQAIQLLGPAPEEARPILVELAETEGREQHAARLALGVVEFQVGNYAEAIGHYLACRGKPGIPDEPVDFNVFESAEAAFRADGRRDLLARYLEVFPDGAHAAEAAALYGRTNP
jgi:hypothetical protein